MSDDYLTRDKLWLEIRKLEHEIAAIKRERLKYYFWIPFTLLSVAIALFQLDSSRKQIKEQYRLSLATQIATYATQVGSEDEFKQRVAPSILRLYGPDSIDVLIASLPTAQEPLLTHIIDSLSHISREHQAENELKYRLLYYTKRAFEKERLGRPIGNYITALETLFECTNDPTVVTSLQRHIDNRANWSQYLKRNTVLEADLLEAVSRITDRGPCQR